jgi:hypothetical protein
MLAMPVGQIVDLTFERDLLRHICDQDDHLQIGVAAQRFLDPVGGIVRAKELRLDIEQALRRADQLAMRRLEFADEMLRPDRKGRALRRDKVRAS